ncbi:hypothetical protein RRG08_031115 [Elysia crispata]|uniref:Uncharacterized protein n=1 Tax=Elysia crispata TaxID=231223 RepID=A0AAE0ZF63_9GAST|nr:hypothetical protein RRG08_031115 [Elysia crispata]
MHRRTHGHITATPQKTVTQWICLGLTNVRQTLTRKPSYPWPGGVITKSPTGTVHPQGRPSWAKIWEPVGRKFTLVNDKAINKGSCGVIE